MHIVVFRGKGSNVCNLEIHIKMKCIKIDTGEDRQKCDQARGRIYSNRYNIGIYFKILSTIVYI